MLLVSISWAQKENNTLPNIEGVWVLDSLYIGEITGDKSEIPVKYEEIMEIQPSCIFERLEFRPDKNCYLNRIGEEPFPGFYDLLEGDLLEGRFILDHKNRIFGYSYQITDSFIILENKFPGANVTGIMVEYRTLMRFKKQSK
jgi:hypothetical protein